MKGTIFEGSSTSLKLWFYAMYLMASTRCGISAKTLEREVGVSYPTALRMFRQVRSLLDQDDVLLSGTVEADEAFFGGQGKWKHQSKKYVGRHPLDRGHRGAVCGRHGDAGQQRRRRPDSPRAGECRWRARDGGPPARRRWRGVTGHDGEAVKP